MLLVSVAGPRGLFTEDFSDQISVVPEHGNSLCLKTLPFDAFSAESCKNQLLASPCLYVTDNSNDLGVSLIILPSRLAPSLKKFLGIVSVSFDVGDQILIRYSAFARHLRNSGHTFLQ
jgi:hypothetical protein